VSHRWAHQRDVERVTNLEVLDVTACSLQEAGILTAQNALTKHAAIESHRRAPDAVRLQTRFCTRNTSQTLLGSGGPDSRAKLSGCVNTDRGG